MYKINENISGKILTIGPDYHDNKGGIGAVIEVYSKYFEDFKFLPSYKGGHKLYKFIIFIGCTINLILRLIFDHKISVVHIHGASNGSFWRKRHLINLSKFFHKKIVYHIHGGGFKDFFFYSNNKNRILKTLHKCDVVVALSERWKDYFISELCCKNVIVINNIISEPQIEMPNKLNNENIVKYLYLGHIYKAKGIFDLVEVFFENKEIYKGKVELHIGGGMFEVDKLIDYISIHDLASTIKFHGWVKGEEKISLLNICDIYILPSHAEGLPVSILEAMSYSMPIISTPVGGIPEIVKSMENGILITPGDKQQIKESIDFFVSNQPLIESMGKNSKIRSKAFQPEAVVKQLESLYSDLLKN